jgi:phage terminase large subunit-like protein
MTPSNSLEAILDGLPAAETLKWARAIQTERKNKIESYYPDKGPLRRELYPKHLEFFRAGLEHRERCFLAANRVGKTEGVGAFETTLHLTGRYPDWWGGRRFETAITAWAAGDTNQTTKDVLQRVLLGPKIEMGTGMIPADVIVKTTPKTGVPDAVETIHVRHVSGGVSELTLKTYEQGRISFQGTSRHIVWLDEEPDMGIYTECLTRTMTTNGLVICTFTPLLGMSEVVRYFLDMKAIES